MAVSDQELQRFKERSDRGMRDPDPELRALHADIKRLAETAERLREDNRTLQEVGNAAVSGLKSGDYTQLRNLLTDELS